VRGAPAGNAISLARLGPLDRTPPSPVSVQSVRSSIFSNSVQLQWQTPPDDANGTGVNRFDSIPSPGSPVGYLSSELYDGSVSPSTTYNYPIWAIDVHSNYSSQTTVTVTTPPAGSVDPRRVGVRPTGSYWGGLGENIDLLSGNLNFTLPLLQAQARGGWKLPISLTYNSQNWRQDPATWNLGADVGYGYGWKLQAGSLTPYWQGFFTAHHYIFTDATGAEYRLDVNTNGVWTSKDSTYVSYDSNTNRVYFNDGSFWVMGCTSAGTEQDAGTMYPTLLEDSNGNQILIRYEPGVGITWPDSSARIREIEDTRALADGWGAYRTYTINYDSDPVLPHITSIVSWIGSGENYLFAMSGLQTLVSPFDGSTQGSTQYLRSVTINGPNLVHQVETNSSGELTKVTFPYGGYLRWVYANQSYIGSRVQREVSTRYISKDGTAGAERAYPFAHDPGDAGRTTHLSTMLDDPDGQSEKVWWFQTDTSQSNFGLVTAYEARPHHWPATAGGRHDDYTWTTDAAGNRYISAVLTTEDMGNPTQVQKKTEQTRDIYGNVTQTKIYNYGNLTTPARTYTNTYLTGANYTSRYIFNRLASSTVTDGSVTTTLASNLFDGGCPLASLTAMTNARQHDDANYGQSFFYRGNVTQTTTPAGVTCTMYNTGGVVVTTTRNGVQVSADVNASTNYTAPSALTTGGLTETMQWNSFLGLTQETGPNGDTTALLYDAYSRLTQTTRPQGAVTTYTYITTPGTSTSTTNGHWTKNRWTGSDG